jgi:hypothetical protein
MEKGRKYIIGIAWNQLQMQHSWITHDVTIWPPSTEDFGTAEPLDHLIKQYINLVRNECWPVVLNPSCLQTTWALAALHWLSHTVPHSLLLQISTRPLVVLPPSSLMAPGMQVVHLTPASSLCVQLCTPKTGCVQSVSLVSFPRHWILDNQICPKPLVKPEVSGTAPE